jgi:hypothetical protein
MLDRALHGREKRFDARRRGHVGRQMADRRARHDESVGMDGIARVRHQDHVAGAGDRLRQIGQTFFGAEGDDRLALGIEIDPKTAPVIGYMRPAQTLNALGHRIAMGARILHGFGELRHDMRRRGQIGIAHAKVDHVVAHSAGLGLLRVHFGEHVGRQALDAIEIVLHGDPRPFSSRGQNRGH